VSAIKFFIVVFTCKSVLNYKINYNLPFQFVLEQDAVFNIWTSEVGLNRVIAEAV